MLSEAFGICTRIFVIAAFAVALLSTSAESCFGDLVVFKVTGNGGDGLLSSNVTPPTGSAGEGGIGATGLTYNTVTNILHVDVGWGTGNGYAGDLSGAVTMLHLHGPTDALPPNSFSQTGPLMIVLSNTINFNGSPIEGGVNENYFINQSDEEALLAGRTYINVHTDMFGMGEIRGYLVVIPEPGSLGVAGLLLLAAINRRRRS